MAIIPLSTSVDGTNDTIAILVRGMLRMVAMDKMKVLTKFGVVISEREIPFIVCSTVTEEVEVGVGNGEEE